MTRRKMHKWEAGGGLGEMWLSSPGGKKVSPRFLVKSPRTPEVVFFDDFVIASLHFDAEVKAVRDQ